MDVISISSDSNTSVHSNYKEGDDLDQPQCSNWDDDVYNVDWNEEAYPPIDYSSEPTDDEVEHNSKSNDDIENLNNSPSKEENDNNEDDDIKIIVDETVNSPHKINDSYCHFLDTNTPPKNVPLTFNTGDKNTKQIINLDKKNQIRQKLSHNEKEKIKMLKEQKKLEKEKKKEEQMRQKHIKAALLENKRNIKPEENIKFFKVHIDNEIINCVYGCNIISLLQQNNIQYVVEPQIKSFIITWSKKKPEKTLDDFGNIIEKLDIRDEKELLYVMDWQKLVQLIHSNELLSHVETIKSVYIDKKITIISYGIEKYFEYKKLKRNRDMKADINDRKKFKHKGYDKTFEEAPNISRDQLEYALIDLQLFGKHNYRSIETPEEFSALVLNFTKSLSQIELKLEKQKLQDDLGWFSKADSDQCVKINKNGEGLLKLWQQQISQFSLAGMETAQAIVSNYNSPLALVNQYKNCKSSKEGELLLQNIQIRRDAGILASTRRVGPQLSKKLYKFFLSEDPESEL